MTLAPVVDLNSTDTFWSCRPALAHVLEFARGRRAGPWAVLGVVLARAVASVEPNVMLPPTIGSAVSLNMFCALVGPSGAGKGAAEGAARDAIQFRDFGGSFVDTDTFPLGSGEGLARTFRPAGADDDEPNDRTRALFSAPEVDTIAALGSRQGSTLMPELRKLFMGEQIGFQNASKATRSVLPAHSYRACVTVGVQPVKAGPLLHDADGGTPQRFVWMRVDDPDAPDAPPAEPAPLVVKMPRWGAGAVHLEVPEVARDAMDRHRLATLRGEPVDPLDGHRMLTRLKVAVALMILDGRTVPTAEDWTLAGTVTRVSDRTRASIEHTIAEKTRAANRARAEAKAAEAEIITDRTDESDRRRIRGAVLRCLGRRGSATRRELRNTLKANLRDRLDDVLDEALEAGALAFDGTVYRLSDA